MLWCIHKYDKVRKDGYQYCTKCGKARYVKCQHKWVKDRDETMDMHSRMDHRMIGRLLVMVCGRCGEVKEQTIGRR